MIGPGRAGTWPRSVRVSVVELGQEGRAQTSLPAIKLIHKSQTSCRHSGRPKRRRPDGYSYNSCTIQGRQDSSGHQVVLWDAPAYRGLPQQQEPAGKPRTPQLSHPLAHGSSGSPPALPTTDSGHPGVLRWQWLSFWGPSQPQLPPCCSSFG